MWLLFSASLFLVEYVHVSVKISLTEDIHFCSKTNYRGPFGSKLFIYLFIYLPIYFYFIYLPYYYYYYYLFIYYYYYYFFFWGGGVLGGLSLWFRLYCINTRKHQNYEIQFARNYGEILLSLLAKTDLVIVR